MRDGFHKDKLLDNRFMTVSPLNHGSFGLVFTAKDMLTGSDVAIKCITKPNAVDNANCPAAYATDDRSQELTIHSKLPEHPNIVNLVHNFETEHHQYMVLELCSNGDLYEAIRVGRGPLETEHVRDFMLQLVNAIDHMHNNGVYHRDIKPENIFLTSSGSMKLGDFGLATMETWSTEFAVGSDRYMAPEQYDASVYGYGYSPAASDIWAIGIVLLNILFQRNPFATPTDKDPLFSDFAADRQTLFDVFPNMSQDTYNVIRHSLALDPANRSLGAVREALKSVVSFTTDDESLDEFCTESPDLMPVNTQAREPLRTPSITTPQATGDSFPWTSALLKTPQKATRQLSTIQDEPEMFPDSLHSDKWQYVDTDEASLSSALDSGLGMSYKSSKSMKSFVSKPSSNNFVGSLPISFSRPNKSPYGGANEFSKSWSDLWDEEEELAQEGRSSLELGLDISRVSTAKPSAPQLASILEDGRGSVTPRQCHAELSTAQSSGTATPMPSKEEKPEKPELPKQRSSSILDKWSALGNFRRAKQQQDITTATAVQTPPQKSRYTDVLSSFSPFGSSAKKSSSTTGKINARERSGSWRQATSPAPRNRSSSSASRNWERKDRDHSPTNAPPVPHIPASWSLDNNWRDHKGKVGTTKATAIPVGMSTPTKSRGLRNKPSRHYEHSNNKKDKAFQDNDMDLFSATAPFDDESDGDDDLELMVGGWRGDFHV